MSSYVMPEMHEYKIKGAFRFWCQKVLPAVYDDSLSYYELLCKVVDYLNTTMEDVTNLEDDVAQLYEFVDNYFKTVDVQEEIDNKLDDMAADGSLYNIISRFTQPILDDMQTEIDGIDTKFNALESNFDVLNNNVTTQLSGQDERLDVLVARMDSFSELPDGSLSTAADAELVDIRVGANGVTYPNAGDAVRAQYSAVNNVANELSRVIQSIAGNAVPVVLSLGSLNTNTGAEVASSDGTRMRSDYIPVNSLQSYIFSGDNSYGLLTYVRPMLYDSNHGFVSALARRVAAEEYSFEIPIPENVSFIRIRLDGNGLTADNTELSVRQRGNALDNALINKGNITLTDTDLNAGEYIHAGMWTLVDLTYKPLNYPSNLPGRIISFSSSSYSSFATFQMVIDSSYTVYYRYSKSNGVWSEWFSIIDTNTVTNNAVYNKGNIVTAGLDLNSGDFIHPGMWFLNEMQYVPAHYPSTERGRIISFSSRSNNETGTLQIVCDHNDKIYYRYFKQVGSDYAPNWNVINDFNTIAFETMFTNPEPFVNNYNITRYGRAETHKVTKLYTLYDNLEHPNIGVFKENIGSDASGEFNIYMYKVSNNTGPKPVVLLVFGEHGDELTSTYIGYYVYKEIIQGVLKKYLTYVDFWIIPIMNPYGYENTIRNNFNDVNLNRDFPANWAYSTVAHNKTANYSLSQPETIAIYNLLVENKDKILFMLNKHDTGGIAKKIADGKDGYVGYTTTAMYTDLIVNNGAAKWQNIQVRDTNAWVIDDCTENIAGDNLIASNNESINGSLDLFANSIGIHGSLLEIAGAAYYTADNTPYYPTGDFHYKELAKISLDYVVNYLVATLENNTEVLSNNKLSVPVHYYTRELVGATWTIVEKYWNGSELIEIE